MAIEVLYRLVPRTPLEEIHYFRDLDELNKWLVDYGKGRLPHEVAFVVRSTYDGGPRAIRIGIRIVKAEHYNEVTTSSPNVRE